MNQNVIYWIDPRDKPGLLHAMLVHFSEGGIVSFEGSLGNINFGCVEDVSYEECGSLKRSTLSPKLDFVVVPLTGNSVQVLWRELQEKDHLVYEGIIHVQIEHDGQLVFGGYDNFHRECVVAYQGVPLELLESLKENGVIRGFKRGELS